MLKNLDSGYSAGTPIPLAGVHAARPFTVQEYDIGRILLRCMEATTTPLTAEEVWADIYGSYNYNFVH